MIITKAGAAPVAPSEAPISKNSELNSNTIPLRLQRLAALLLKPHTVRAEVISSKNSLEYASQLRRKCDLTVGSTSVKYLDISVSQSWCGLYHLTQSDRGNCKRGAVNELSTRS
jgi:hypothetical protein